jgi:hypothetical protein
MTRSKKNWLQGEDFFQHTQQSQAKANLSNRLQLIFVSWQEGEKFSYCFLQV